MAFVHTSVNRTSQSYLSNEQRYNYTTPKSFLEFIRLYQSLLRRNGRELRSKMERLENGLLKLHSTSAQVSSILPVLLSTAGSEGGKGSPFPENGESHSEHQAWFSRGPSVIRTVPVVPEKLYQKSKLLFCAVCYVSSVVSDSLRPYGL